MSMTAVYNPLKYDKLPSWNVTSFCNLAVAMKLASDINIIFVLPIGIQGKSTNNIKSTMMGQHSIQGDHLCGKPGNIREFDSFQGNVMDSTENQGIVMEKILSGKSCLKLFISTAYVCPYRYLVGVCCVLNVKYKFWIMCCCIPTPTTDSNTRTGMI